MIWLAMSLTSGLLHKIPGAYSSDSYFADPSKLITAKCVLQNNLWTTATGQIIVPESVRQEIMVAHHDDKWAGHFGVDKTAELIRRHFWWPAMVADITTFVSSCPKCQVNKNSTQAPTGLLQPLPIPDDRWHTVSLDFLTGFPRLRDGFGSILVFVDKLTKFVILVPRRKTCSTEQFARYFTDHVVAHHGVPMSLLSDRDTRFTSRYWRELCKLQSVKLRFSTAFHPETDGQTERVNKVVEEVLRNLLSGDNSDWSRLLPCVQFSINNARHSSTGFSPFFLNYGRHPRSPLTNEVLALKLAANVHTPGLPALSEVLQNMTVTQERVKRLLQAAQARQKFYADQHRRDLSFAKGDQVYLSTEKLPLVGARKLLPKWFGPCLVEEKIGETAYRLQLPSKWKQHRVFHVSRLKPYEVSTRFPGRGHQRPPPDLEYGADVYDVENILDRRVTMGVTGQCYAQRSRV